MTKLCILPFTILILGVLLLPALITAESSEKANSDPEVSPRGLFKRKRKGGFFGGYQGGYGGYGGFGGYPPQYPPYPPINIGISQSQSSASAGGGGYGSGYYPNNYQYNGRPNFGYGRPGGFNRPGYYENGQGSYNNQFNGNYYGPSGSVGYPGGGWNGYRQPYGNFYDEPEGDGYSEAEERDKEIYNNYVQGFSNAFDDTFDIFARSGKSGSSARASSTAVAKSDTNKES